jgi:hypothetical protein
MSEPTCETCDRILSDHPRGCEYGPDRGPVRYGEEVHAVSRSHVPVSEQAEKLRRAHADATQRAEARLRVNFGTTTVGHPILMS